MLGSGLVWSDSMWGEVSGARSTSDAGLKGSFARITLGQSISGMVAITLRFGCGILAWRPLFWSRVEGRDCRDRVFVANAWCKGQCQRVVAREA